MAAVFDDNPFMQEGTNKEESNVFLDLLQTVVIALSICIVIYLFIATPNEVHGQSMEPNFQDAELLLTNKVIQLLGNTKLSDIIGEYYRGDVVIFKHTLSQEDFIKRIVAIEGDTVVIEDGHVYVNGIQLQEHYLPNGRRTEAGSFLIEGEAVRVPEGSYIVLGDNRGNSTDSRSKLVGFVKRSDLKGRVFFRYWPLDTFGLVKGHHYTELDSSTSTTFTPLLSPSYANKSF